MIKRIDDSNDFVIFDAMRKGHPYEQLAANQVGPENAESTFDFTSTGFGFTDNSSQFNAKSVSVTGSYIYMAIRRPHKPPTAGTDVFAIDSRGGTSPNPPTFYSGFPVDLVTRRDTYQSAWTTRTRLLGQGKYLEFSSTIDERSQSQSAVEFDQSNGVGSNTGDDANNFAWMFKRAPGFFDVVHYRGTGSSRNLDHNLGAVPELIIQKRRSSSGEWHVFADVVTSPNSDWYLNFGNLNRTYSLENNFGSSGISGAPTSTVIPLGNSSNLNGSSSTFVMYLFASLDGISKIGSYSGTGSNINVDCGFTAGARFVLIKRIDTNSTNWYVWDTKRGIVSGNDPYFLLNSTAAQVTNTDYIDPLNAGFTVTSSAPAGLNASGGSYLFFAIA